MFVAISVWIDRSSEDNDVRFRYEDDDEELVMSMKERAAEGFYTEARDTVVNGVGLTFLIPQYAKPVLEVGEEVLNDTTAILVAQAADVRKDNGEIVGTFVCEGELLSRGESKSGFCAILGGDLYLGIADATPMFESALMHEGYFFRQYPLVFGGQVVENKPKGKSYRKALAIIDIKPVIVISKERLTFLEFSQALVDAGVNEAIYLVGSSSQGFYINEKGEKVTFGANVRSGNENINYIVWRNIK